MGQRRRGLRALQSHEGWPPCAPIRHASTTPSAQAERERVAQQWSPVPAQLSSRFLGRLSLLGQRAGALRRLLEREKRASLHNARAYLEIAFVALNETKLQKEL